jgi:hypothetical protein
MEFKCSFCGNPAFRTPKEYNRTVAKTGIGFCSRQCVNASRKCTVEKVCACGGTPVINKSGKCKPCWKEYYQNWYAENKTQHLTNVKVTRKRRIQERRQKILEYLQANPCIDCGESDPVVLDFDHVRGRKKSDVTTMIYASSWENVVKEIEKCEVRCANCHRRRTAKVVKSYRCKMDS